MLKHIQVDGIIDDFSRVQSSRKKSILNISDVPLKNSIILSVSAGSPLEVQNTLNNLGYTNLNYLSLYRYCDISIKAPAFIDDFKEDYLSNKHKYLEIFNMLNDEISKKIFTKIINFKISFDLSFMNGFTNNHEEQYFDKDILPKFDQITFVDGGGYVGDTLPSIIKNYPNYKKIYLIEPNTLHLNIAKKKFANTRDIEFINYGLGKEKIISNKTQNLNNNCEHDFVASNKNTIDNLVDNNIDFIKLDIEGAEQDAIMGAKKTIKNNHPVLAICIYHKAEDWYKVPALVFSIRKDYKIYLRHYMEGIYETVMYFIPIKSNVI